MLMMCKFDHNERSKMLNDYEHGIVTEDEYNKYIYAGHWWLGVSKTKNHPNGILQNMVPSAVFNKNIGRWI